MRASWSPRPVFAFFVVALEPLVVVAAHFPEAALASSSGLLLFIVGLLLLRSFFDFPVEGFKVASQQGQIAAAMLVRVMLRAESLFLSCLSKGLMLGLEKPGAKVLS